MPDNLSEDSKRKPEAGTGAEDDACPKRVEDSPVFLEWLEKKREQEAEEARRHSQPSVAPARKYPTEKIWPSADTIFTIVGLIAAAIFIIYAVTHWGGVSFSRTATVVQTQTIKGEFYLYLNDGTVWRLPQEPPYYVVVGDEIRFTYASTIPFARDESGNILPAPPPGFTELIDASGNVTHAYQFCFLSNETRLQPPVLAERVAGDLKRDSCPAAPKPTQSPPPGERPCETWRRLHPEDTHPCED